MNSFVLFAVAALFGSTNCDQECFRAVFKECVREPVPSERMALCDEVKYRIECVYRMASKCKMHLYLDALKLYSGVQSVCALKKWFDKDKACYIKAINDSVCVEPINEAMNDINKTEDFIRANKNICNLFEPYSNCVEENVERNCNNTVVSMRMFDYVYNRFRVLSKSVCEQLILPADEKDSRPDNFGMLNVYETIVAIFESA